MECPSCNETIVLCESDLDLGEITCPSCGEKLEFEFDEDEEEDDEACCCGNKIEKKDE